MSDPPRTWHYGLVARWWAEFNHAGDEELAFYRSIIERSGQPVLDAGCGTGRMLLPLLQAGVDIDGSDLSPDMLAHCRAGADRLGLETRLHAQPMHELDLPRRYRTIICCGTFGIGGQREQDRAAIRRWHDLLLPGGTLAFDLEMPYGYASQWPRWLPANRAHLPEPWPDTGLRRQTGDGDEIELLSRVVELDPLEQRETRQMRARLWRDGRLIAEEDHTYQASLYFRNEVVAMLEQAGFTDVEARGAYRDAPATPDDETLVFIARKAG
jgi:SAM-dependent methyltransferase